MAYLKLFSLMALTATRFTALSTATQPSLSTAAVGAITPSHLPLDAFLNTSHSEKVSADGRQICTNDPQFQLPGGPGAGSYVNACYLALRGILNQEFISSIPCRFLSSTSSDLFPEATVRTPKRYTYNYRGPDCTVVVAMLADFNPSPSVLPSDPRGPFQSSVVYDWQNVYEAALALYLTCFTGEPHFGYVELRKWYPKPISTYVVASGTMVMANIAESSCGVERQMGVFFWATGSVMNGYLPRSPFADLEANASTVETE